MKSSVAFAAVFSDELAQRGVRLVVVRPRPWRRRALEAARYLEGVPGAGWPAETLAADHGGMR